MPLATTLVIESPRRTIQVTLRRALSIGEIYWFFIGQRRRPAIVTLSNGIARVCF